MEADGRFDATFGSGGTLIQSLGGEGEYDDVALQADGLIVGAGWTDVGGKDEFVAARHLAA